MLNEPRNWKWMVPAVFAIGLFYGAVNLDDFGQTGWAVVALGIGMVLALAAGTNYLLYVRRVEADTLNMRRQAQTTTEKVRLAEALRQMHPDAIHTLNMRERMAWRVRRRQFEKPELFMDGTSIPVPLAFLEYVLDKSNTVSLMAKHNNLSEGKKTYSDHTDYELYDSLYAYLYGESMITAYGNNSAPQWIYPYSPEVLREQFGLVKGETEEGRKLYELVSMFRSYYEMENHGTDGEVLEKVMRMYQEHLQAREKAEAK
jgi:hypothetical protein